MHALSLIGVNTELVWHRDTSLEGFDGVILPGGFAHGDYLRTGAIARFSPVMSEVERFAIEGYPVLGICNGFQILCEAGLLSGAMVANRNMRFICRTVRVKVEHADSVLTRTASPGDILSIPLNSYEGNFVTTEDELDAIEKTSRVVLRYCDESGDTTKGNPNGSSRAIAGICNKQGNVAGLMPHPERASENILGSTDGRVLLESFVMSLEHSAPSTK